MNIVDTKLYTKKRILGPRYKGSAEHDERLKLLCEIRHNHTNYPKLTIFYCLYPNKRLELNRLISKLINTGPDYVPTFRRKVKKIEEYINLNSKEGKERFLIKEKKNLIKEYPDLTPKELNEWALINRSKLIRANNKYIQNLKRRSTQDEKNI